MASISGLILYQRRLQSEQEGITNSCTTFTTTNDLSTDSIKVYGNTSDDGQSSGNTDNEITIADHGLEITILGITDNEQIIQIDVSTWPDEYAYLQIRYLHNSKKYKWYKVGSDDKLDYYQNIPIDPGTVNIPGIKEGVHYAHVGCTDNSACNYQ